MTYLSDKRVTLIRPGNEQVYAWIGLAHLDRNATILARKAFEKALEINPDYGWVKHLLMKEAVAFDSCSH
ncbi:MAG: hypothetical protein WBW16_07400 [Bacteroidota bacterium]